MTTSNVYSLAAARDRNRKKAAAIAEAQEARAAKIIKYIDGELRVALSVHEPHLRAALYARESAWIAAELKSWNAAKWWVCANRAGLLDYPSDDTKKLVISQFAWSASNVVDVRVSP